MATNKSFVEQLDAESLKLFSEVGKRKFSEQAMFVLNAFYEELKDDAECIYSVIWDVIKMVDMRHRGVQYIHLYEEGDDLDFDMALYLFESVLKFFNDDKNKNWRDSNPRSIPTDVTAIVRKKEIRDRVDVNFDGRVSFLEYLLYQYNLSPKDLMERSKGSGDEPEEVRTARLALEEVNKRIRAYEAEKQRLEQESELPGVKGLRAKNELAQLNSGPLAEDLRRALITAEAKVRIAQRKYGAGGSGSGEGVAPTAGTMWWMNRDLEAKKSKYGSK